MRKTSFHAGWTGLLVLLTALPAGAVGFTPKLEAEGRWFYEDRRGDDDGLTGSVAATLESFHEWDDGQQRIVGEFFGRYDADDDARTHADVREFYHHYIGEAFELRSGFRRVFWGVTESRHLTDIINQTDFVEGIDGESKLGQPMINLALIRTFGTVDAFFMPYQRARTFPGENGRPRMPLPVHAHEARYESARGQKHRDYAVRYVNSFGPFDVGLAWFDGTARDPRLIPCLRRGSGFEDTDDGPNCDIESGIVLPDSPFPDELFPVLQILGLAPSDEEVSEMERQIAQQVAQSLVLVPHYDRLRRGSLEAQAVFGALALKLEAIRREQQDEVTWAAVTGFEYTFGDVWATGVDIGVLAEYLYDEKEDLLAALFDDELFFGTRLALNDIAGTQVLAGVLVERRSFRNRLYGVEASRRLGNDWRLSLESRIFSRAETGSPHAFFADQDHVRLVLERFF
jgi:hypothetical protein